MESRVTGRKFEGQRTYCLFREYLVLDLLGLEALELRRELLIRVYKDSKLVVPRIARYAARYYVI